MNTVKEIKRMTKSLKTIERCNGDCKRCDHCKVKTATISERYSCYCFYCDVDENIQPYSNTMKDLRAETLEALRFELS